MPGLIARRVAPVCARWSSISACCSGVSGMVFPVVRDSPATVYGSCAF